MKNALIIFLRNPEIGAVKTRLANEIGAEAALGIYNDLVSHTRSETLTLDAQICLFYTDKIPDTDDWGTYVHRYIQEGSDLGSKMEHAIASVLENSDHAILIGSDCPGLTSNIIENAFDALRFTDIVIGPATDGGYYLIGMKLPYASIFDHISWSTPYVYKETIQQILNSNLNFKVLPRLSDIDTYDDLIRTGWTDRDAGAHRK